MKKLLELQNVNFISQKKNILSNISFTLYEGMNTFICGNAASGKTTLLKAIAGQIKYKGHIEKKNVFVLLDENNFAKDTVEEEINYKELKEEKQKVVNRFITKTVLKKRIEDLTKEESILVKFVLAFLKQPTLLCIDNLFRFLSLKNIQKIKMYLKKKKITYVVVSTDIEDAISYPYLIVLNDGEIAMEGKTMQVLEQEKILKRLGIGLPFYIDLSIQLRLYGILDKICIEKEELEGALWK